MGRLCSLLQHRTGVQLAHDIKQLNPWLIMAKHDSTTPALRRLQQHRFSLDEAVVLYYASRLLGCAALATCPGLLESYVDCASRAFADGTRASSQSPPARRTAPRLGASSTLTSQTLRTLGNRCGNAKVAPRLRPQRARQGTSPGAHRRAVQMAEPQLRLLVMLIDGDNAQPSLMEKVLAETAKYGIVTTRRIYGDWTTSQMSGWKDSFHAHAIQPMQEFRYTVGENATDSALIIDTMDLLHAGERRRLLHRFLRQRLHPASLKYVETRHSLG